MNIYMAELRQLADRCQFRDYLDKALYDRFVCGLVCGLKEAIQRKLLTIEDLTLKRAYETAHGMETAERQASEVQASLKVPSVAVQYVASKPPSTYQCWGEPIRDVDTLCGDCCGKIGHLPGHSYSRKEADLSLVW